MGRKIRAEIRVICLKCGQYGAMRIDDGKYIKVRHNRPDTVHYNGMIDSRRVKTLLKELTEDERKVYENTIEALLKPEIETKSIAKMKARNAELERYSRNLSNIIERIRTLEVMTKRCPRCGVKVRAKGH
jgi:hypothetical protein